MRYVVGYVPNQRGAEAVRLASTLAASDAATLDLTVALPVDRITFDRYSPDHAYFAELESEGREWLEDALAQVPEGTVAAGKIAHAETITEGLIEAATDPGWGPEAALIVIGTSHRGLAGRFTIGSVASALLHSSPVPVALAPADYQGFPSITRITCATGTREGADALLDVAINTAARRHLPLRLMSLLALGARGSAGDKADLQEATEQHAARLAEKARAALPADCPVTTVIGHGDSLEECVEALDFAPSEIVLVGSSRLAGPRKMFIGATANKMLRALPVPMIVVPRDYEPPRGLGGHLA